MLKELLWILQYPFIRNKDCQTKLDWNFYWKVEIPDRIYRSRLYGFYYRVKNIVIKNNDDGDIPF